MGDKLRPIEVEMFDAGYASSRLAAAKLRKNYRTVLRQVWKGQFRSLLVGSQHYIEIASIVEFYGTRGDHFNLDDWSDVITTQENGEVHVSKVSV